LGHRGDKLFSNIPSLVEAMLCEPRRLQRSVDLSEREWWERRKRRFVSPVQTKKESQGTPPATGEV
jgi:hypothetical protein